MSPAVLWQRSFISSSTGFVFPQPWQVCLSRLKHSRFITSQNRDGLFPRCIRSLVMAKSCLVSHSLALHAVEHVVRPADLRSPVTCSPHQSHNSNEKSLCRKKASVKGFFVILSHPFNLLSGTGISRAHMIEFTRFGWQDTNKIAALAP